MVKGEKFRVLMQIVGSNADEMFDWFDANKKKFNIEVLYTMGIMPGDRSLAEPLGFFALFKVNENGMINELFKIKSEAEKIKDWQCQFFKTENIFIQDVENIVVCTRKVDKSGRISLFGNKIYISKKYRGKNVDIVFRGKIIEIYFKKQLIRSLIKSFLIKTTTDENGFFNFSGRKYNASICLARKEIYLEIKDKLIEVYYEKKLAKTLLLRARSIA